MSDETIEVKDLDPETQAKLAEEEKIEDPDKILPSDHHKPFSVAQFKRWRKNLMQNLNGVLQQFQRDQIGAQVRVNLAWNAMNSVLRSFVNKGLITERDIAEAGAEMMREAQANVKKAKDAAAMGRTLQRGEALPTPIEKYRDDVNRIMAEDKKE